MAKGIYWDNFELFKSRYPATYRCLSNAVNSIVNTKIISGLGYILAQEVAGLLNFNDFQFEVKIPREILHSYAGMELYEQIKQLDDWYYDVTTLRGRDFDQTIYFKGAVSKGGQ